MGDALRIALICTERLPVPPIRGGAIQVLIEGVLPHLSQKHQVTVYSARDPDLKSRERSGRVEFIRLNGSDYAGRVRKALAEARARGDAYDVVHVFNRPADLPLYKAAMPESRFVLSLHNEMFHKRKISFAGGREAIRCAERIMTISDYIGRTVLARFPEAREKLTTVYSGVDLSAYRPVWDEEAQDIRRRLRQKNGVENKKVVLFAGRLSRVKGPDILIRAMEKVAKDWPEAVLLIVGGNRITRKLTDEYSRELRAMAKKLDDRVVFTGFVPPRKMPRVYLAGDVFVCSSQWMEPLARVHYEAMGAGLPVITTNRGGNGEIVRHGETGLLVDDYDNPRAFARAISRLFADPAEAERLARAGRALMERNHGFEHVSARLERVYLEALRRRASAAAAGTAAPAAAGGGR